jgi:hypothetical protein
MPRIFYDSLAMTPSFLLCTHSLDRFGFFVLTIPRSASLTIHGIACLFYRTSPDRDPRFLSVSCAPSHDISAIPSVWKQRNTSESSHCKIGVYFCHWVFYEVLSCGRTVLTENVVKWTGNQELTACIADFPIDTSSVWDPQNLDPRSCFLEKSGSELPE